MTNNTLGIDHTRSYFIEEISEMWECEYTPDDKENLRKWWNRNFKGLKTAKVGRRYVVDGALLAEWIRYNSSTKAIE